MDKFDISESDILSIQKKLSFVKEFFLDDSYWPKNATTGKHNKVNDHNRGKMIQIVDSLTNKILFLDKCKVKSDTHLELVKDKIDKVLKDLDLLAVEGLSNKKRFQVYDLAKELRASLETAQLILYEHMHEELSEDEQMRILRSPTSQGPQQLTYRRLDSHSSVVSVTEHTRSDTGSLETLEGPSNSQKRHEPELSPTDRTEIETKKTKTDEESEETVGELNHLVHAELDNLKTIIESDSLNKRITVTMRKELTGSYNRICSIVRDITYQHAKLEGAYKETVKNKRERPNKPSRPQAIITINDDDDDDETSTPRVDNDKSYSNAVQRNKSVAVPARVSVHDGRVGKKNSKTKQRSKRPMTPAAVTENPAPQVQQSTTEGTFQVVERTKKRKGKKKTNIDLNTIRKPPALPRFILKDSATSEEYPKLWKMFWTVLRNNIKNPRLAVHKNRTKGPTILVPDNKDTLDALRDNTLVLEIIPRKPRLTLKGLDSSLKDEEVIQELLDCNPELGLTETDAQDIRVAYHSGPRSGTVTNFVLEVSPEILRRIEGKKAYIGGIRCTLILNHSVSQCFKCQKYGHTSKNCREEEMTCRNCAGSHDSRTCQIKEFKCCNCKGEHKASSDSCPTKTAALKRLAKRTDFGQPLATGTTDKEQ
ncbi:unnamed protein product [Macrosiphum euphorbiae]|uniref:CCHC-type domain-containing protein n=1 Tax=Macrosiphum euphorbiae TaxID=13131 RepID=A0AAV0YB06_9HEMI|nr:unnamed protein product [Macrosiphum euphorbiae]